MVAAAFLFLTVPLTGTLRLPPGTMRIHAEIRAPAGAHDLKIIGRNTVIRAADDFKGRALLSCRNCQNIELRNITFDGNRRALEKPAPIAPPDRAFADFYGNNGLLLEHCDGVHTDHLTFRNIAALAILVNASARVALEHLNVVDSGSRNDRGRNNTTGGVLFEEGTHDFSVTDSTFENVRGNAIWTHSRYHSPRNASGRIVNNRFAQIGRDAVQVGHATGIAVEGNIGTNIGFPVAIVDVENAGTPVAIDTAGNVDRSSYFGNEFSEVNGKCIDLDGFHDGAVRANRCRNAGRPEDYPNGHFGIVFNNSSIEMQSRNVRVESNDLEGMKFGGIFVIGVGHRITNNRLLNINTAHCNETHATFGCIWKADEPDMLRSGIYLGAGADRPDPARSIVVEGNTITGWGMPEHCIGSAPGVSLTSSTIKQNHCSDGVIRNNKK